MTNSIKTETLKLLPAKSPAVFKNFAQSFLTKIPERDLKQMGAPALAKTLAALWDLFQKRKKSRPSILIHTPKTDAANHTCIDIVSEDMAFLIDSIVAEIVRHGQLIHMLVHPTLNVKTDAKGEIKSFHDDYENGLQRYSLSHIELRGTISGAQAEELLMGLTNVIEDVRNATRDWLPMKDMLREAQRQLSKAPAKFDDYMIEEYQAFLEYLYDNNFTLLGFREYKFSDKKGQLVSETVKSKSLGLLRDEVMPVYLNDARKCLSEPQQKLRRGQGPLTIAKVNRRSTVHRRVPMDAVAVKTFAKDGSVTGEMLFVGLFTSVTYSRSVSDIPFLRVKIQNVINRTQFIPGSHDRRALRHILEKYPRDEVLQISENLLYEHATSILRLQERPRIALYMRSDPFGRYISALVYVPRERYETRLRLKLQNVLEGELGGQCTSFQVTQDDSPLARVIYLIDTNHLKEMPKYNAVAIEEKLEEAGQLWAERLRSALESANESQSRTAQIVQKYGQAFPVGYDEEYEPRQAIHDIRKIDEVLQTNNIALDLYRPHDCDENHIRLKIYNPSKPMTLSDVLPMLERMGLRVISELPFEVEPHNANKSVWIHDFLMETNGHGNVSIKDIKAVFEEAFDKIWNGRMESDGLNKLVIGAKMNWREITILRTYLRYLRQIGLHYSREYIETALADNPKITLSIVKLFLSLFDPNLKGQNEVYAAGCAVEIDHALESVVSLDQDRILRSITAVVNATLRTNFFQKDKNGQPKPYISIKLDSKKVDDLPEPRPFREIWVYSPRTEAIHLRMDKISRGGIRWSDRNEDFRTEVLGLMKAQQVKNSVIVPMGAKGGFVVKNPPKEGGRAAMQAEGIECYKILIRGLLDITDNLAGEKIVPPKDVVRRDSDDPYLVVAADKGTATFSDIANALSIEYGHWLGDAFASGGSAGYDHKVMGITARGAWESVKRHFRELNHDTQTQDFDVVGVGDMGGDVFGNGMLLSEHIRLIGAFNHLHIFCDPNPDTKSSFKERQRLFEGVKGWDEYNTKLLSKGGKIFNRSEKSLQLSPEIQKRFDIQRERVTPNELIQAMLRARVDLLWVGGIGTYIKATKETHGDVGDKSNDALRINASEVRAKVMGEGANLAITQRGRIEYAMKGGKLNADFIDNSGGVDSSDHEVNIKILMNAVMRNKTHSMDVKKRDKLLASMTNEVANLVLRNNYQQAQAISLMELQAADMLPEQAFLISELERKTGLNRALESLPDDEEIQNRIRLGHGLTRPELATLQAHAKIAYTWALLDSDIPNSEAMEGRLHRYFPKKLRETYSKEIRSHKLKREIICTTLAGSLINRMGPTFVRERMAKSDASPADVAKAFIIVREAFGLRELWHDIESLDNKVPAIVQLKAFREISYMVERAIAWLLSRGADKLDINRDIVAFEKGIAVLRDNFDTVATKGLAWTIEQNTEANIANGFPQKISHDIALMPLLGSACDIIRIADAQKADLSTIAKIYFELGEHFHLDWMRTQAGYIPANDHWTIEALDGVVDSLYSAQAGMTVKILRDMGASLKPKAKSSKVTTDDESIVACWIKTHGAQAQVIEPLFAEMRKATTVDLSMLIIAEQKLRNLYNA
ncbi:MAG: NAD-glutamate dehydrogenase [Micavibrio aeruginosavorus]|uniref:NAD-glutamate dehydrogenase n=1 Tax=Micavibrio aeruginosavorus TaxID=349221 RepID=A0A2W5QA42_9BACT|nr:MAG: NAD-glutamate dehydrogenase [Micavibrio aeruginosavorus]